MATTQRGSQTREPLEESGYRLIKEFEDGGVILEDFAGKQELWMINNFAASYVIVINTYGYEFVRSLND